MAALFQDTFFGYLVRLITGSRLLPWPETIDVTIRHAYLDSRRSLSQEKDRSGSDSDLPAKDDRTIIDWTESDAANPHNWSSVKKAWTSALIALLTSSVYIGTEVHSLKPKPSKTHR